MDDIEFQCGNDLRYLLKWIHGPHVDGDSLLGNLAEVAQALVLVVVSAQVKNQELGREFRAESAQALTQAAARLASAHRVEVHA
jgi:hypothetical protein